jgi:hypothetical protein
VGKKKKARAKTPLYIMFNKLDVDTNGNKLKNNIEGGIKKLKKGQGESRCVDSNIACNVFLLLSFWPTTKALTCCLFTILTLLLRSADPTLKKKNNEDPEELAEAPVEGVERQQKKQRLGGKLGEKIRKEASCKVDLSRVPG